MLKDVTIISLYYCYLLLHLNKQTAKKNKKTALGSVVMLDCYSILLKPVKRVC